MAIKSNFHKEHLPTSKTTDVGLTCRLFFPKFPLGSSSFPSLRWQMPNMIRLAEIIFHCLGFCFFFYQKHTRAWEFMMCFGLAAILRSQACHHETSPKLQLEAAPWSSWPGFRR